MVSSCVQFVCSPSNWCAQCVYIYFFLLYLLYIGSNELQLVVVEGGKKLFIGDVVFGCSLHGTSLAVWFRYWLDCKLKRMHNFCNVVHANVRSTYVTTMTTSTNLDVHRSCRLLISTRLSPIRDISPSLSLSFWAKCVLIRPLDGN